eukprot:538925-Amphidinium_carterae.3
MKKHFGTGIQRMAFVSGRERSYSDRTLMRARSCEIPFTKDDLPEMFFEEPKARETTVKAIP